jgi:TP901 family phage tail tape measure protein
MAGENLKILITGTLNTGSTIGEINAQLKGIEKKINKLKLNVQVNDNVLDTLNRFAKQMERVSTASLKTGNDIKSSMKNANQGANDQIKTLKELSAGYEKLSVQVKKYADGSTKSITTTMKDAQGNGRVVTQDSAGNVVNYKDINNLQLFQNEQAKVRKSLMDLAKTGQYTTQELRKIGQGINTATSLEQLNKLKTSMSNLKLNNSFVAEQERVTQALKKMYDQGQINERFFSNFNKVINSTKNVGELNKVEQALKRVQDVSKNQAKQQDLLSQAQTLLGGNSKKLDVSGVNNLITSLKNIKPNASSASNELKRLETQLKDYAANARVAHQHTLTFSAGLKQALSSFSLWAVTAQLVYAPIRALQDMTQRLIDIDTQMTSIKRVLDLPDFAFVDMLKQAVDTSDQLSSKLTDVLSAYDSLGRMGFSADQLEIMTKTSQVLQNISDLNADSSVNTLVSAMLNFNITAKDSIKIADQLNEVDNHFAVSTLDLSDGIRKAAATSKTFGVDLSHLIGYIAAIGSTTRESGTIIGNGLKTVFSRITTMKPAIESLASVGVSINDMAGNVKPVSDILESLASRWNSLSKAQQENLGVQIAGRYQLTR